MNWWESVYNETPSNPAIQVKRANPGTFDESGVYNPLSTSGAATDMSAALTRATYEDWKNTYLPITLGLMQKTTFDNPSIINEGVTQAIGNVNRRFNASADEINRQAEYYGQSITPQQAIVNNRSINTNRSLQVVDAANRIRQRLADRDNQIALGGLPNIGGKNMG